MPARRGQFSNRNFTLYYRVFSAIGLLVPQVSRVIMQTVAQNMQPMWLPGMSQASTSFVFRKLSRIREAKC